MLREIKNNLKEHEIPEFYSKIIYEFVEKLSSFVRITGVLLYGSVARGSAIYRKSDIDLIIVSPDFPEDYSELIKLRRKIRPMLPGGVDSLWVSEKELEQMFLGLTGFILDALYEGIILYDENGFLSSLRNRLLRCIEKGVLKRYGRMWMLPVKRFGEKVEVEI